MCLCQPCAWTPTLHTVTPYWAMDGPLFCPALGICERQLQAASSHFLTLTLPSVLKQPILHSTPTVETRETGLKKAQVLAKSPEERRIYALTQQTWPPPWEAQGTHLPKKSQAELSWISQWGWR